MSEMDEKVEELQEQAADRRGVLRAPCRVEPLRAPGGRGHVEKESRADLWHSGRDS